MPLPYTSPVDVFLILTRGNDVLLALRKDTGYADGLWNFPSGKLEAGEPVTSAMCREADEEIGLEVKPDDLAPPAVLHHRPREGAGRLGLFFALELDTARHGEPVNAEPHKCAAIRWFPARRLPAHTVPYTRAGHRLWRSGLTFGTDGW